jgi:hypothetical protein
MYSFLVLGIIPGTNFQITFGAWLNIIGLTLVAICMLYLYRRRSSYDYSQTFVRQPLPASRLHLRVQ